jgi:hypothetical protein
MTGNDDNLDSDEETAGEKWDPNSMLFLWKISPIYNTCPMRLLLL